jgi:phage baseplate assembly protein W
MPSTTVKVHVTTFKDLDLTFQPNPFTGDVIKRIDADAVKGSIVNLVSTMNYERPFHPELGSPVFSLLFELASPITAQIIRTAIINLITHFEPRADLTAVSVVPGDDQNSYAVSVQFSLANYNESFTINLLLERLR